MVKKSPLRWDEIFLLYSRTALWFANSTADPLGSAASLAIKFSRTYLWLRRKAAYFFRNHLRWFGQTKYAILSYIFYWDIY